MKIVSDIFRNNNQIKGNDHETINESKKSDNAKNLENYLRNVKLCQRISPGVIESLSVGVDLGSVGASETVGEDVCEG